MKTYLVEAILVTIFCCQPFGIVAIVYSAIAMSRRDDGNMEGAYSAANSARTWCWVAFWCGFIPILCWLVFVVLGGIAGSL